MNSAQEQGCRLLIISIIFVGIFSFIANMAFRIRFGVGGRNKNMHP